MFYLKQNHWKNVEHDSKINSVCIARNTKNDYYER